MKSFSVSPSRSNSLSAAGSSRSNLVSTRPRGLIPSRVAVLSRSEPLGSVIIHEIARIGWVMSESNPAAPIRSVSSPITLTGQATRSSVMGFQNFWVYQSKARCIAFSFNSSGAPPAFLMSRSHHFFSRPSYSV